MPPLSIVMALALAETRLRLRRLSTLIVLLVVVAISWKMIPDPRGAGHLSFLTAGHAAVAYTSAALAMGSAKMAAILFGLAGFFLLRGRSAQDLRIDLGGVISASPAGNGLLLASRWLGGVAYLSVLALALLLTVLCCHLLRGSGVPDLLVYVQTYVAMLLPLVCFCASCAILCDSHAGLMGKAGDMLFFVMWIAQFPIADSYLRTNPTAVSAWMLIDLSGLTTAAMGIAAAVQMPVTAISKGFTSFDPSLAMVTLPAQLWTWPMAAMRFGALALSLLPLLLAILLFHRYSPDRVRAAAQRARRTPLAVLNDWLRPLARWVQPVLPWAARLPGLAGQALADVALAMMSAPAAIAAAIGVNLAALLANGPVLALAATAACAAWGILLSDVSVRDHQAANEDLGGVVPGGAERRVLRQLLAGLVLGLLFFGVIALRWSVAEPMRVVVLLAGIASGSALATLLGRTVRTGRLFMAAFLFWLYVSTGAPDVAMLDAMGIQGAATSATILVQLALAAMASVAAVVYNRYHAR